MNKNIPFSETAFLVEKFHSILVADLVIWQILFAFELFCYENSANPVYENSEKPLT